MTTVTAAQVKELRKKTSAGMMDCKKALLENNGDMEAAVDWLRTKGLAAAQKKAGRVAAQGLVSLTARGTKGTVVEINSETDFVARNEQFQAFATTSANLAHHIGDDVEALKTADYPQTGRTVAQELSHMIATVGENMSLRRVASIEVGDGVVGTYVHGQTAPGLGRIGVLVGLESTASSDQLAPLAKQLAMHVAASSPQAASIDDLDPASVERERAVLAEQVRESGKPEEIIEKMVEGRLRKFYQDVVLTEQTWVHDGKSKVSKVLQQAENDLGTAVKLAGFVRFALGEGIEKEEVDFAAEVAAQVGS